MDDKLEKIIKKIITEEVLAAGVKSGLARFFNPKAQRGLKRLPSVKKTCKECGFTIRGPNHVEGPHHKAVLASPTNDKRRAPVGKKLRRR